MRNGTKRLLQESAIELKTIKSSRSENEDYRSHECQSLTAF